MEIDQKTFKRQKMNERETEKMQENIFEKFRSIDVSINRIVEKLNELEARIEALESP